MISSSIFIVRAFGILFVILIVCLRVLVLVGLGVWGMFGK